MDNFKGYPVSVTEHKASTTTDATAWTARDTLVHMLRAIDEGQYPNLDVLVLAYRYQPPDLVEEKATRYGYYQAAADRYASIGVLYQVLNLLAGDNDDG